MSRKYILIYGKTMENVWKHSNIQSTNLRIIMKNVRKKLNTRRITIVLLEERLTKIDKSKLLEIIVQLYFSYTHYSVIPLMLILNSFKSPFLISFALYWFGPPMHTNFRLEFDIDTTLHKIKKHSREIISYNIPHQNIINLPGFDEMRPADVHRSTQQIDGYLIAGEYLFGNNFQNHTFVPTGLLEHLHVSHLQFALRSNLNRRLLGFLLDNFTFMWRQLND